MTRYCKAIDGDFEPLGRQDSRLELLVDTIYALSLILFRAADHGRAQHAY